MNDDHARQRLAITLPREFVALCAHDGVEPALVIRGFIADLGAIVYHGLLHGLIVIARRPAPPATSRALAMVDDRRVASDPRLVGLLANMVLRAHSEVQHVN